MEGHTCFEESNAGLSSIRTYAVSLHGKQRIKYEEASSLCSKPPTCHLSAGNSRYNEMSKCMQSGANGLAGEHASCIRYHPAALSNQAVGLPEVL